MNLNRVCNLEDFYDFELLQYEPTLTDDMHRKTWELALEQKTLHEGNAVKQGNRILGVAAGHQHTIFNYASEGAEVYATDLYKNSDMWANVAPHDMLTHPEKFNTHHHNYNPDNLIVEHADARDLPFPNDFFDGIFCCSSIEHVGTWDDIAKAASEIGRVLKPGGVASISTEYKITGNHAGYNGLRFFTYDDLMTYVVVPSGLFLNDKVMRTFSKATLDTRQELIEGVGDKFPHIVLAQWGIDFTSIHLALYKP